MQRIVEVLDQLHQVRFASNSKLHGSLFVLSSRSQAVINNISNKFESVRHEARVGRDEILRRAADDLHCIRADRYVWFPFIDLVNTWLSYLIASRTSTGSSTSKPSTLR